MSENILCFPPTPSPSALQQISLFECHFPSSSPPSTIFVYFITNLQQLPSRTIQGSALLILCLLLNSNILVPSYLPLRNSPSSSIHYSPSTAHVKHLTQTPIHYSLSSTTLLQLLQQTTAVILLVCQFDISPNPTFQQSSFIICSFFTLHSFPYLQHPIYFHFHNHFHNYFNPIYCARNKILPV